MIKRKRRRLRKNNSPAYQARLRLSSAGATARLGARLARQATPPTWLLSGALGSGKTTLVRGALRALGVRLGIPSPTFVLSRHYQTRGRWRQVVHVDAYRIQRDTEIAALDLSQIEADPRTLIIVEWPERLRRRWPRPRLEISLRAVGRGRWAKIKLR